MVKVYKYHNSVHNYYNTICSQDLVPSYSGGFSLLQHLEKYLKCSPLLSPSWPPHPGSKNGTQSYLILTPAIGVSFLLPLTGLVFSILYPGLPIPQKTETRFFFSPEKPEGRAREILLEGDPLHFMGLGNNAPSLR